MNGVNWKDALARAAKTFIQAASPAVLAAIALVNKGDVSGAEAALIAGVAPAVAAVLAFAWNVALDYSRD